MQYKRLIELSPILQSFVSWWQVFFSMVLQPVNCKKNPTTLEFLSLSDSVAGTGLTLNRLIQALFITQVYFF
jgi:hypothetical protein